MEQDYHYYAIYALSKLAGFSKVESEIIAYASQYVDNATESEPIEPFKDQHFDTVRTAHYGLKAFDWNVQKKIYMPFHFLPQTVRRVSPGTFTYVTQPCTGRQNELAVKLLADAFTEENKQFRLIRIGVVLHTLADTFSHFGFSGREHDENTSGVTYIYRNGAKERDYLSNVVMDFFVPNIGHTEVFKHPDLPYLTWEYEDFEENVVFRNNTDYCLKGADLIFKLLNKYRNQVSNSASLKTSKPARYRDIESLFQSRGDRQKRCNAWKSFTDAPAYNEKKWRKDALIGEVDWNDMSVSEFSSHSATLRGKRNFDKSNWAYFHRAALKQRHLVMDWLM